MKTSAILLFLLSIHLPITYGQVHKRQQVLTHYKDALAKTGQEIQLFGTIVRHYQLRTAPYVLLLPNDKWIFLGDQTVFDQYIRHSTKVIITGVLDSTNHSFRFNNAVHTDSNLLIFSFHKILPDSEKLIAKHPYFSKITRVQPVYECETTQEIQTKRGEWIFLYGRFKTKNQTLYISRSQTNSFLSFKLPLLHHQFPQKGIGYFVVMFDTLQTKCIPIKSVVQHSLVICKNQQDIQKNYGQLVALKGKKITRMFPYRNRILFYKAAHTFFYPYNSFPNPNRKIWIIDRPLSINKPLPFHMSERSSSVGYWILWNPKWMTLH